MKYLVLGSSGQIGGHFCSYIEKLGNHSVIPFDVARNPAEDLRHPPVLLKEKMREADFVLFLAFDVGGALYLQQYQHTPEFISNNIKLMNNTFDVLQSLGKPFIFASSQMANMSQSPYGALKTVGEHYTSSLHGLVVKFWNVYGVENDPKKFHVITDFIKKARRDGKIGMISSGLEERQFLYADDCCECLHKLALEHQSIPRNQPLHVTNFKWNKIIEVAEIIGREMKVPVIPGAQTLDPTQLFKKNEPDPFILKYWQPTTSLEEGIRHVIKQLS
ncbi:MAG: NAD-dependent epimerase/dehydratase family protein [Limisphaerales bacterium]